MTTKELAKILRKIPEVPVCIYDAKLDTMVELDENQITLQIEPRYVNEFGDTVYTRETILELK